MPVYEYVCPTCLTRFEQIRLMQEADYPAPCPRCETDAKRQLSRFALKRPTRETTSETGRSRPRHMSSCPCCVP